MEKNRYHNMSQNNETKTKGISKKILHDKKVSI